MNCCVVIELTKKKTELCLGFFIDCEQSLFFFRFSESNARAGEGRSRETRETRAAAREEKRETLFFRVFLGVAETIVG